MRSALAGRGWWIALALLVAAIVFGSLRSSGDSSRPPGRQAGDESGQGFAAWAELLRRDGLQVDELQHPISAGSVDPDTTLVALDIGTPTDDDVAALRSFVADGGYLITGGATSAGAIRRITGIDPRLGSPAGAPVAPVLPVAETAGVRTVDPAGGLLFSDPAGGLPALANNEGTAMVVAAPGEKGTAVVLSTSDPLANGSITLADNAQLAIDLGRASGGRPVLFLQSLARASGSSKGFDALPQGWGVAFLGLILAGLTFIASRLRRLGPPDGDPRPAARPRSDYVDAVARILARRGELAEAAEPVRRAAIEGIERRSGTNLGVEPGEREPDKLAAAAELAGVPAEEAEALAGPLSEPKDAIRAARALTRVRR